MDSEHVDFLNRLQEIVGECVEWVEPGTEMASTNGNDLHRTTTHGTDGAMDSDGSADMVFSMRHVREEMKKSAGQGAASVNNTRPAQNGHQLQPSRGPVATDITKLEQVTWKEPVLERGQESRQGDTFVPWKFVRDYPFMYVGKRNSEKAASLFEREALHDDRVWDFFYLHHPPQVNRTPVLFVPTYQFEHFLDVVNAKIGTLLTIPEGSNSKKFRLTFGVGGTPRPRYLGRSKSLSTFTWISADIPSMQAGDALEKATTLASEDFMETLDMIWHAGKKTGKGSKSEKNRRKRIQEHLTWGKSMKRVQRYLGLRETADVPATGRLKTLNLDDPLPIVPDQSNLFVAIDVEAWEMQNDRITEVGVAILDTKKIEGFAPGESGKNWFSLIDAHHIRIRENAWCKNSRHVHGCPELFNFGQSTWLNENDVGKAVEKLIKVPAATDGSDRQGLRPVVLVFHEATADLKLLQQLYIDVLGYEHVVDVADTRCMQQYATRSLTASSVRTVLAHLRLDSSNLHNAGNDAVYTLQCMISLAIKTRLESLNKSPTEKSPRLKTFGEIKDCEGWTSSEDAVSAN